jgi:hypothetical protein
VSQHCSHYFRWTKYFALLDILQGRRSFISFIPYPLSTLPSHPVLPSLLNTNALRNFSLGKILQYNANQLQYLHLSTPCELFILPYNVHGMISCRSLASIRTKHDDACAPRELVYPFALPFTLAGGIKKAISVTKITLPDSRKRQKSLGSDTIVLHAS